MIGYYCKLRLPSPESPIRYAIQGINGMINLCERPIQHHMKSRQHL